MRITQWIILGIVCLSMHQGANAANVITTIPPSGITISSPGTYVFANDITWSPVADGQAILIEANDVTLDLQNFRLESTASGLSTTGILGLGCANLAILNGTIANMGLSGIKCELCTNVSIDYIMIDGLSLSNIVTYTVPTGILCSACQNAWVSHCTVQNVDVTTGSTAGIQFTATTGSRATDCLVTNMINHDGACTGIGHLLCVFGYIDSCTISNLTTEFVSNLNTEGHTSIGIIPVSSTSLLIQNCMVSNITGCCDDAHGISVFECSDATVKNCKVLNVLDGAGPEHTGAKATGIEVYASRTQVIKCSVSNITAINPQDKQATGFSCAQCEDVQFIKCFAENVNVVDEHGNQNSALGYGTGFGWAPDPRITVPAVNVLYKHCTARNCQVGFDSWFHINSTWKHIHSICNGIAILDLKPSQRTLSCNPCSECGCTAIGCYPTPLVITLDNLASNNKFSDVHIKYCPQ